MIQKILVANRGEIAVRIIRACRALGIKSVAIYSKIDADALHVALADQRICIGEGPSKTSYLNKEVIIQAAINMGADAIHPGFGFLSENADFVRMCEAAGITFIGPSADVIDRMGNKSQARKTMMEAGVPITPGSIEATLEVADAMKDAERIGYPIMIKASAGGGGKGMRIAFTPEEFESQFLIAQNEAASAFGDGNMYLEKYVINPRHIEIQVIGDTHGNIVTLGERDCSVQRNNQKMIEESPSPAISREVAAAMARDAYLAAKSVGYVNAGTIEFIVEEDGTYYFMEMNTRIQVEHGVTELVTGTDLIAEQIAVAMGKELSFTQEEITFRGHAIECRINAEIPEKNFMPSPGKITNLHLPAGNGVRVDSALYVGYTVPSDYDSMIAKILVVANDRASAIRKMKAALDETVILGVSTNLDFQYRILDHETFQAGEADTGFVAKLMKLG